MCFRPADVEPPVTCPSCGKKVNAVAGVRPAECPFCEADLTGVEPDDIAGGAMPTPGAPGAPGAPAAPAAPGIPAPPSSR